MKNDIGMRSIGSVPDTTGKNVVVGSKQIRRAITANTVRAVFLALDADPCITEPIEALCLQMGLRPVWVESRKALGKACRIDVSAAAAAIID